MWGVVFKGFAGVQLSGSPNRSGDNKTRISNTTAMRRNPRMSLIV